MEKPAHMAAGIATGVTICFTTFSLDNFSLHDGLATAIIMFGAFWGGMFPDIDHPNSYIGRKLRITSFLLRYTVGHRGPLHSPLVLFLLCGLAGVFVKSYVSDFHYQYILIFLASFFLGTCSHILLDALTKRGVPILFPFVWKDISIGNFTTGGVMEKFFTLGLWGYTFFIVASNLKLI
ncbi:metal-dependent hydrolase [Lysinibacillus sp. UGB7]|uniref:metal-dependent hydrolase n=1 Tax=Lysinibacillus sp. UGB7 TaxID=3411039 RepID=UPI003B79860D